MLRPLLLLGTALAVVCLIPIAALAAQTEDLSRRKLPAVMVAAPPKIDGDLSDSSWLTAAKADTFSDSFTSSTEIDQTEARLTYDSQNIYVAFLCHDAAPDSIVGREIRRDASFQGEDSVAIQIDPYRTRRGDDIDQFQTNPLGTQNSYIAGGRASKAEWKGEWECAARRVPEGWAAEMRIPWKILNYPSHSEPADIGLNFRRRQQRTQILSYWSNLGPSGFNYLAGDWEKVQLPKSAFRRQLSLLPFSVTRYNVGRGKPTEWGVGQGKFLNLGLDARLTVTPELMAVGTLNPDFASIESAVAGIDFTRGERFVPDTRPFFLEGKDFFDVTVSGGRGWGEGFFSGRIPAFDAGAKLYGRYAQKETIGVLAATDFTTKRNDLVGRWMHDVGPSSFVGGYVVERDLPDDHNLLLGVNESIRKGNWLFRTDLSHSSGTNAGGGAANGGVRWDQGAWHLGAGYTYIAPRFNAANGFVPFTDFQGGDAYASYHVEWREGAIRSADAWTNGVYHTHTDGDFFRESAEVGASIETRNDWRFRAGWEVGRFENEHDNAYTLAVTRNVSNRYDRVGVFYSFGTRADAPINYIAPTLSKRLPGKWDLSVSTGLLYHTEDQALHVIALSKEFDPFRQVGGRLIIRNGLVQYFVSYRISGGKGLESYFLVGDPVGATKHSRTYLMTKFVYPVSL